MAALVAGITGYLGGLVDVFAVMGAAVATNRLLQESGDGLLLEDSSGDLALE